MEIRLIASDIDGTLLCHGRAASPATVAAVRDCRAAGVEFAIASGRWFPSARDVAVGQLGIEDGCMIICNGGAVARTGGEVLWERRMSRELAEAVYALLLREPVMLTAYSPEGIFRLFRSRFSATPLSERSCNVCGRAYRVADDDRAEFERAVREGPYKMEAYSDDPAPLARLRARLQAMGLQADGASAYDLEIMAPGAGKGDALRWLTQYLGLRREQVMAFGDYLNDLTLLQAAGWPMAVGNAPQALRRACRVVTPRCADDGVAWAIRKYVLGGEEI